MLLNATPPAQLTAYNQPPAEHQHRLQMRVDQMRQMRTSSILMAGGASRHSANEIGHSGEMDQPLSYMGGNGGQTPDHDQEAASETLTLVLNGGPKWGFRIKQLNDNRVIVSRIDRGPAERSGLQVYDELLSVNHVELNDSPRSLLLHDYPDQFHSAGPEGGAAQRVAGSNKADGVGERTPLMALDTNAGQERQHYARGLMAELSKLDFAYQLIKHSSASNNNKLVLVVRRFLSAAYARASALAASNTLAAWNFSSSSQYRPSISQPPHEDQLGRRGSRPLVSMNQQQQQQQQQSLPTQVHDFVQQHYGASKRAHASIGTNVYKCCDCYCDNGGE